ncbi:MAG: mechanosensitive ion channel protein MscS [Thiotrichales bacterium SG8_50]|nr:MAG: mechanosensitive ion channel protein MscS [Thiotrichales bacterium SG8_50]
MDSIFIWLKVTLPANLWIAQVFVVIFGVLLANYIQHRVLSRLYNKLKPTGKTWDDALVDAMRRPLTVLIWIVGVAFAGEIVRAHTGAVIFNAFGPARDVGVIATIVWFLLRLIRNTEENIIEKRVIAEQAVDRTTVDAVGKLLRASVIITAVLVVMQTLGYSVSGILAFGGIGGVAVGFAAKDLLANFFGGLMVYLDRPFAVGDWIRSPDRDIEGTVEEIGWRLTIIRTFDKRPLYVPNSTFASIAVENPSRMSNRRINETIGIRYDDLEKVPAIIDDVKSMLYSHPDIDHDQTIIVNFNTFGPSSLDFFIYTFTRTINWIEFHEVKQDVLLKISGIIAEHGAEIAYPTSTVHLASSPPSIEPGTA